MEGCCCFGVVLKEVSDASDGGVTDLLLSSVISSAWAFTLPLSFLVVSYIQWGNYDILQVIYHYANLQLRNSLLNELQLKWRLYELKPELKPHKAIHIRTSPYPPRSYRNCCYKTHIPSYTVNELTFSPLSRFGVGCMHLGSLLKMYHCLVMFTHTSLNTESTNCLCQSLFASLAESLDFLAKELVTESLHTR